MVAGEIAAKHGDLQQVSSERGPLEARSHSGRVDPVERGDLGEGENAVGRGVWLGARRHGDEEYAPADHRNEREELGQPLGGLEPRLLGTAAGLHDLVEHLCFPAQGVPAELLDRRGEIVDRQIGHQLPVDWLATGRRILFEGVDVSQNLRTVVLLLAHGRQGVDGGELDLQPGRFVLIDRNAMTTRPRHRRKLGEDAMSRIVWGGIGRPLGQPVRLHSHEEAGTKVPRGAIELVDVALPVTHMHAALGRANERDGLAQVLQPAVALLRLDRHARGIDVPLERERSLEFRSCPELHRRQTEGGAGEGDGQARMHQHPAQGQHVGLPGLVAPGVDGLGEADFARPCAAVDELRRVLQDEDRTFACRNARRGRGEMAGENAMFGHTRVVEEAVGRLRCRPVAAGRRNGLAGRSRHLIQQSSQPTG